MRKYFCLYICFYEKKIELVSQREREKGIREKKKKEKTNDKTKVTIKTIYLIVIFTICCHMDMNAPYYITVFLFIHIFIYLSKYCVFF